MTVTAAATSSPFVAAIEPITATDEEIREALEAAEVPPLLPALAYATTQVLQGVIQGGTASARGQIGRPAAGKTGTAQNYSNAWFVGATPQLTTAVHDALRQVYNWPQ